MSYAPDYVPLNSFADDEANQASGRSTVRTTEVDANLAAISAAHNDLNANVKKLQRDDDKLRDFLVEPYALSEQTRAMMVVGGKLVMGEWKPNTIYLIGMLVQRNAVAYVCQTTHNSGPTFNLGFWIAISGDGQAAAYAEQASISAASAVSAASTAGAASLTATAAAAAALVSQNAAAASALAAQNSADSIAGLAPVNLSAYMLGFLGNNTAAGARSALGAAAAADLVNSTVDIRAKTVVSGGTSLPAPLLPTAAFQANKTQTTHGGYCIVDSTRYDATGNNTDPIFGSASVNDNSITQGGNPTIPGLIDHHFSLQAHHHVAMAVGGILAQYSAVHSLLDVQSGSVSTANLVWVNNPLGSGGIGNLAGLMVENLTRGSNNWGIFCKTARSFMGGLMHFGDTVGTSYTTLGYNGDGFLTATPRSTYAFRIAGVPGNSARLNIGAIGGSSNDSILEQEASGRTRLAPRPGFGILLDGTVEVSGGLVLSLPAILAGYTVATLPSAAAWARGHAEVSDANSTVFNAAAVGGGANKMGVRSNGTAWVIG
jgi:hypothetical protein